MLGTEGESVRRPGSVSRRKMLALVAALLSVAVCMGVCVLVVGLSPSTPALAGAGLQQDLPKVRCEPPSAYANTDEELTVDMYVENVENLYGVDLILVYSPTIGQVQDSIGYLEGIQVEPLSSFAAPGFIVRNEVSPTAKTIWYAMTRWNPQAPVSGSGPVARIHFRALEAGTFPMIYTYHQLSAPGGVPMAHTAESCQVTFSVPTGVELSSFSAEAMAGQAIALRWETVTEANNLGFNLYRAESATGPGAKLNEELIPVHVPGSSIGAQYEFLDETVLPAITYYYTLESVDTRGRTHLYGPVSASVPAAPPSYPIYFPLLLR